MYVASVFVKSILYIVQVVHVFCDVFTKLNGLYCQFWVVSAQNPPSYKGELSSGCFALAVQLASVALFYIKV